MRSQSGHSMVGADGRNAGRIRNTNAPQNNNADPQYTFDDIHTSPTPKQTYNINTCPVF